MSSGSGRSNGGWAIILTIIIAGILGIVPMPSWLEMWRPEWVTLVLIYWVIALPHKVGLISAWVVGFFIDVLEGSLLGLNGLVFTLVAYAALNLYQRLRMFTPLQQSTTMFIMIGVQQMLIFWILKATSQNTPQGLSFMMSALSSGLVWPLLFLMLRYWRRAWKVN